MTLEWVSLHTHTDASLQDGLGTVDRLVTTAGEAGFRALAMTDHGTLANAVAFTVECKLAGIKPILGVEGYVAVDEAIGHITLLANGNRGFSNLVRLQNLAHASGFKRPAFTIDQLIEHADDVICLTGCVASPLNQMSLRESVALASRLRGAFGHRLFAEAMFVADVDTWSRPMELASKLGLKMVVTNDVHFPLREDAEVHPILTKMKAGFEYNSRELWLKPAELIVQRAIHSGVDRPTIEAMAKRTVDLANKITEVKLQREPRLPHVARAISRLRAEAEAGFSRHLFGHPDDRRRYQERMNYELDIITKMDYAAYFLILKDIIDNAKAQGVRVGPGRGSGAGSLVLYLLGITDIDPLRYDLPFERFLSVERRGMPDVDVDFDSENRHLVLEYASKAWNAIPIAIYSRYTHKVLVHDLSKMFRVPREDDERAADSGPDSEIFKNVAVEYPGFGQAYDAISNQINHKGKHAGGVVITDVDVPVERTGDTLTAAWVEGQKNELSYAGIVKFDLLGLSALSAIRRLERRFGYKADAPIADHPAFKLFQDGDLAGIFQFSGSQGIKVMTMDLEPTSLEDLTAINALYRPGALDVGSAQKFHEWKRSPRKVPRIIADILAPTYGAIVYQEQVMQIFARITGGSLGEADLARRVIVKSKVKDETWVKKFEELRGQFIAAATEQGLAPKAADKLWNELAAHSRYSFNKAHAVSYARIAWEMAWWKWRHPSFFYAAMLNVDAVKSQEYTSAAINSGIRVLPPHVNTSTSEWEAEDDAIYMPLDAVKFLGQPGAEAIVKARESLPDGKFESLAQFMELLPKKIVRGNAREGLHFLGAFDGVPGDVADLALKKGISSMVYTGAEAQMRYLGFIVPSLEMIKKFAELRAKGLMAGIISSSKLKSSRWGPYRVYYLTPEGVFWSRDRLDLQNGMSVCVRVKDDSGKALRIGMI